MKKYDCTKTVDFIHEYLRCWEVSGIHNLVDDDKIIEFIQQWSDEHPEKPTITKDEKVFLEAFRIPHDKHIMRSSGMGLYFQFGNMRAEIWHAMFPFIEEGESWSVDELKQLKVEE